MARVTVEDFICADEWTSMLAIASARSAEAFALEGILLSSTQIERVR